MLNIRSLSQIMRFSDTVRESDTMALGQDTDSFKEVKDSLNPKRYVKFETRSRSGNAKSALRDALRTIGDGTAVMEVEVTEENGKFVFAEKGFTSAIIVDMKKIDDFDEVEALKGIIHNTMIKMQANKLEVELENKTAKMHDGMKKITDLETEADKMRAGMEQIKDAAQKAKPGLGSRKVNALKEVIEKAVENTK